MSHWCRCHRIWVAPPGNMKEKGISAAGVGAGAFGFRTFSADSAISFWNVSVSRAFSWKFRMIPPCTLRLFFMTSHCAEFWCVFSSKIVWKKYSSVNWDSFKTRFHYNLPQMDDIFAFSITNWRASHPSFRRLCRRTNIHWSRARPEVTRNSSFSPVYSNRLRPVALCSHTSYTHLYLNDRCPTEKIPNEFSTRKIIIAGDLFLRCVHQPATSERQHAHLRAHRAAQFQFHWS